MSKLKKWVRKGLLVIASLLAIGVTMTTNASGKHSVIVDAPWVRMMPAVSTSTAAYFSLKNTTDKPMSLIRASSASATTVEMHTTVEKNGLMSMQPLKEVALPVAEVIEFKPGGHHIMLMGLKKPLKQNQKLTLMLHFSDGSRQSVVCVVRDGLDSESFGKEEVHHHHDH